MQKLIIVFITLISLSARSEIDLSFSLESYFKKSNSSLPAATVAEKVLAPRDFIVSPSYFKQVFIEKIFTESPNIVKIPKIIVQSVSVTKSIFNSTQNPVPPPVPALAKINAPVLTPAEALTEEITDISGEEYKMIQGLIYFEMQKKYDMAMSIFSELLGSSKFKTLAELKYAESAYELNLHAEYRQKIMHLLEITPDKNSKLKIVQSLVQNINAFTSSDMEKIETLVDTFNIDVSKNNNYLYKQGKFFVKQENLAAADNSFSKINPKSPVYMDSVLLSASINYRKGEVNKAIAKLEKVIPLIENDKKNKIRNMMILTLARLYFQKGKYNDSYQTYLKIDRASPLWIQSVVEQAWAQILVGDHIGAAGNMFSLHTELFKKIYLPESYIVRSVGYLNLCQYGDALHVLTDLDSRFRKTHEKLTKFESENKMAMPYYDLVRAWYNNSGQSEINNLPRSFIAELAIHPSFTGLQQQINNLDDENSKFTKITADFQIKDQQIRLRMTTIKNEYQTLKNQQASVQTISKNEIKASVADLELQIIARGKEDFKKMRVTAQQRLENEKTTLKNSAADSLKKRYGELMTILSKLLEQEEILAYEVYSGAGEHIRYQMAGGKINDRTPAALTPEEKKSYKWKFRGEVWEDEIGHYRSSLKNVCAIDEIAQKGDH